MPNVNTMQLIVDAREELEKRVEERERNDERIAQLRIMLRTLVRFADDEALRGKVLLEVANAKRRVYSLQEAVCDALMRHPAGLTSNQMRDDLEQTGFDLEEYSQPLSAIMTTLSRLVKSEHVRRRVGRDKSVTFRMKDSDEEAKRRSGWEEAAKGAMQKF
jgi:hypothetical protein